MYFFCYEWFLQHVSLLRTWIKLIFFAAHGPYGLFGLETDSKMSICYLYGCRLYNMIWLDFCINSSIWCAMIDILAIGFLLHIFFFIVFTLLLIQTDNFSLLFRWIIKISYRISFVRSSCVWGKTRNKCMKNNGKTEYDEKSKISHLNICQSNHSKKIRNKKLQSKIWCRSWLTKLILTFYVDLHYLNKLPRA